MDQLPFMNNVSVERLQEIENERQQVMLDPNYQNWVKELNVSRSYSDPTPILNARDMMEEYKYSTYKFKLVA
jgi:hypothetical protein